MRVRRHVRRDEGAIALIYAIVLSFVLMPLLAVGTTTLVRSTTVGELQRAADAGALAGAATIPFGDVNFARNFIDATTPGPTDRPLRALGLAYDGEDPLDVACQDIALPQAADTENVGHDYADPPTCAARYLSDLDTLRELQSCADALAPSWRSLPDVPDLSPLLPALLYPGVQVTMRWHVVGPLDRIIDGRGSDETVTSIAHRRFKNMVVVPEAPIPGWVPFAPNTINLNPFVGDVRNVVLNALDGSEQLLSRNSLTAPCASALAAAHDDILDAVDPPSGGPDARDVIAASISDGSPLIIARVEHTSDALGIPFLDFVPVCAEQVGTTFVGHLTDFGSCSIDAPGGFRAALRRT